MSEPIIEGGFNDTPVTPEIQALFFSNLAAINDKLDTNWTNLIVASVKSQVVAGVNYRGTVKGDYGSAVVTIHTKWGSN
jgi:hypothetical protein